MSGVITVDIKATSVVTDALRPDVTGDSWSTEPPEGSRRIAPLTSRWQAYYWTHAWQTDEAETLASLAAGAGREFPDAQAAIRWLLNSGE